MSGAAPDHVYKAISECERYWRATGVPRDVAAEMKAELEQHLMDAHAEGKPTSSVVGPDLKAFAEEWAREFRPPVTPERVGPARGPAILAAIGGVVALVGALMIPTQVVVTATECCPERVIHETSTSLPGGVWAVGQSLLAVAVAIAASVALFRGRRTVGALLLAIALPVVLLTPFGLWVALLFLVSLVWAMRPWQPGPNPAAAWTVASLALASAGSLVMAFAPVGVSVESTAGGAGQESVETVSRSSLLQTEGPWIILLLAIPIVVAALPVAWRRRTYVRPLRWVSAALLTAFATVSAASIGLAYFPSAIAMFLAAALDRDRGRADGMVESRSGRGPAT